VSDYKANRTPMPDELAQQIPMVHAACEALGGQISLESARGQGATFRFHFPADRGDSYLVLATSAGPAVTRSTLTS